MRSLGEVCVFALIGDLCGDYFSSGGGIVLTPAMRTCSLLKAASKAPRNSTTIFAPIVCPLLKTPSANFCNMLQVSLKSSERKRRLLSKDISNVVERLVNACHTPRLNGLPPTRSYPPPPPCFSCTFKDRAHEV